MLFGKKYVELFVSYFIQDKNFRNIGIYKSIDAVDNIRCHILYIEFFSSKQFMFNLSFNNSKLKVEITVTVTKTKY